MSDILQQIIDYKHQFLAEIMRNHPLGELKQRAQEVQPRNAGFINAIKAQIAAHKPALIAELKKASPSKGLICADFNPVEIATKYQQGGASCLSILTDEKYFQGSIDYLQMVAQHSKLPILRKDFMINPYQIIEAKAIGADCVLLIMAALSDELAIELESVAHEYGLDVLVEVHDELELQRALDNLKTPLIGVNNRNLKTLEVDLQTSIRLRGLIPADKIIVCESGIKTNQEVKLMQSHEINCFLVGESLMLQPDIAVATRQLIS